MLEGINALLAVFSQFVQMLFPLPFYGAITVGWLFVSIELIGIIVAYFIYRLK